MFSGQRKDSPFQHSADLARIRMFRPLDEIVFIFLAIVLRCLSLDSPEFCPSDESGILPNIIMSSINLDKISFPDISFEIVPDQFFRISKSFVLLICDVDHRSDLQHRLFEIEKLS